MIDEINIKEMVKKLQFIWYLILILLPGLHAYVYCFDMY